MSQFHPLTVSGIKQETRDTIVVTFDVPQDLQDAYRYAQGQYLTLRTIADGQDLRRSYSICSAAQESQLRVAIKRAPGGAFSTWAHDTLRPGAVLEVMPPLGHFHSPLSPDSRGRYLAFAAGSGITPILSIMKTTLLAEPHSSFTLFYGNRASSSVIFKEELSDLKDRHLERFNLVHVMSREPQDIDLFNGRIDREKCEQFFRSWIELEDIDMAFICGPEPMMRDVSDALQAHGLAKDRIKAELFAASQARREHVAHPRAAAGAQHCEVTLVMDGAHIRFTMEKDKQSVLAAALRQGIDIRHSCKAGVCSTCRCKVTHGKVEMDAHHALEDYEVARGFALSCQSFPLSDKLVLDFDQDH